MTAKRKSGKAERPKQPEADGEGQEKVGVVRLELVQPTPGAAKLKQLGGSESDAWNNALSDQVFFGSYFQDRSDVSAAQSVMKATGEGMLGIAPKDEIEGMLVAQLIVTHGAVMECHRRAALPGQPTEIFRLLLAQAAKLSRAHAQLAMTLDRHRGKGVQKVKVEHVHVHSGGQAIVGNVATAAGAGEGDGLKNEESPHALGHDACAPLRRADPSREPVPVAGDEEREMPPAWRAIDGRARG